MCSTFHATRRLLLGQYSRMLDLGGMPHSSTTANNRSVLNACKHSKLQIVAFDFNLLTRSSSAEDNNTTTKQQKKMNDNDSDKKSYNKNNSTKEQPLMPNMDLVNNVANLLNFDLGSGKKKKKDEDDDDFSRILSGGGSSNSDKRKDKNLQDYLKSAIIGDNVDNNSKTLTSSNKTTTADTTATTTVASSSLSVDVRAKYAGKLRKKIDGGGGSLSGIDLAKSEKEGGSLRKGDAAGHLAVRAKAIASNQMEVASNNKNTKWVAKTGTGNLLSYITNRSMKIVLLPIPTDKGTCDNYIQREEECQRMDDFVAQLKHHVVFDVLIKNMVGNYNAKQIINNIMLNDDKISKNATATTTTTTTTTTNKVNDNNNNIMIVSDRDDYINIGRENGFITCRVRRKNKFNGNITAHYNVEEISEIQEVINEINGISYNAL